MIDVSGLDEKAPSEPHQMAQMGLVIDVKKSLHFLARFVVSLSLVSQ